MRDVCEFENDKLSALGRMQVSGWILIINQNDLLDGSSWTRPHGNVLVDSSSWTGPHGQVLMDRTGHVLMEKSSWIDPHGRILMDRSSWTGPHGYVLMDGSSWTDPRGYALMDKLLIRGPTPLNRNVIVCWTCELYVKVNEHSS